MKKNEYLLSISEVKNILKNQSKEELIKLVIDSYKVIPQLKEYITVKYANQDTIEHIREVPNVDFEDKVICKMCGTEFIRK